MAAMEPAPPVEQRATARPRAAAVLGAELYVLTVAGIVTGVIVVGVGSRLAMLVLRLTSPARVEGVTSDDGFTIGRFTLSGTYNLLVIGAVVGVLGAAAYQWVRPWLLGPRWFRRTTLALAAGAVVGSMLVHADGVDFTLLEPMWLAVASFVVLPAVFAVSIAAAVDRVERRVRGWAPGTWRRWILPVALALAFPPVLVVLAFAAVVMLSWGELRDLPTTRRLARSTALGTAARAAWLAVAVLGLFALLGDIADLRATS